MRDFRDAKAMAHTLRETLTAKAITISHSETLELVFENARHFGPTKYVSSIERLREND